MPGEPEQRPDASWVARRSGGREDHRLWFNTAHPASEYQRDRARIIHAAAFRALQSKTQVLGLGENDFYRTRLTHSLEVAQIGSGIVEHLAQTAPEAARAWLPSTALIEAICLAHDLGHPPFGHGGEVALNVAMLDRGGFEGNGQTLRILARLGEFSAAHGIDVTRRTLFGVLKYPVCHGRVARYPPLPPGPTPLNISAWHPPKCVYDDEAEVLDWVFAPFVAADRERLVAIEERPGQHARSRHMGLDCSLMEIADDIAYGVHDLEDALALRLLSRERWMDEFRPRLQALPDNPLKDDFAFYSERLLSPVPHRRKHAISRLVNYMIINIALSRRTDFEHPLLALRASLAPAARALLTLCQQTVFEQVIQRPEILALRHRGQRAVLTLFDTLDANPCELLPAAVASAHAAHPNPARVLCDYLAGLTDVSAAKLYRRLTLPGAGSIFDMI